jgi:hypothetical protein
MRAAAVGLALLGVTAVLLTACKPPPEPVVVPELTPPPTASRIAHPMLRPPVPSNWHFQSGDTCSASAISSRISLEVTGTNARLKLVASEARYLDLPGHAAISMTFTGNSGNWTITGRRISRREIAATSPMSEDSASRILVLLDGGIIRIGNLRDNLPPLRIPNAGQPGIDWFECIRERLLP